MGQLLLRAGATVEEDWLYVDITIDKNGLRLTKSLFSPYLTIGQNDQLRYGFEAKGFLGAEILINGSPGISCDCEYDFLRHRETPALFWDRAYEMVCRVRDRIMTGPEWPSVLTWKLLQTAIEEHKTRPRWETYLLVRNLRAICEQGNERWRQRRRELRRNRQRVVEELMRLAYKIPHSLNVLRRLGQVRATKIAYRYWRLEAEVDGETWINLGHSPVAAASGILRRLPERVKECGVA
ncbi:hypothetical protein V3F56_06255 [Moorellaceae bacterium AZ2]